MVVCAARLQAPLLALIADLAKSNLSIAEINRRVGARAEEVGLVRPSYARVRQLVHAAESIELVPGWGELVADVALRYRLPDAIIDKAAGTWPMPEDAGLHRHRRR